MTQNYDETGKRYRVPEPPPDRSGLRVFVITLIVVAVVAAGAYYLFHG